MSDFPWKFLKLACPFAFVFGGSRSLIIFFRQPFWMIYWGYERAIWLLLYPKYWNISFLLASDSERQLNWVIRDGLCHECLARTHICISAFSVWGFVYQLLFEMSFSSTYYNDLNFSIFIFILLFSPPITQFWQHQYLKT